MKMLMMKMLALATILSGMTLFADDAVLYWMVQDPLIVSRDGTQEWYIDEWNEERSDKAIDAARVRVVDAGGEYYYLDLLAQYGESNTTLKPTGISVLEVTGDSEFGYFAGPAWADVSQYNSDGWSFQMELGHYDDSGEWTVSVATDTQSWKTMRQHINESLVFDPGVIHWAPEAFVAPEPTSGLLLLFGGAMLALRRRRAV